MTDGKTVHEGDAGQDAVKSAFPSSENAVAKVKAPDTTSGARVSQGWLRRFFWLDDRVAEAKRVCFGPTQPGFAEFDLAKQARAGIVQIGEAGESNGAVLLLERIEAIALMRSHLLIAGHASNCVAFGLTEEDLAKARTLPRVSEIWNDLTTVQQTAVSESVLPSASLNLLGLEPKARRALVSALRKLVNGLTEPLEFEANRIGRVLFLRWARLAGALVVCLGFMLSVYGAYTKATAKPNVALHRPVTISSQMPGEGLDHTLVVDGDHSNLGFHTNMEANPWVVVDLGSIKPISEVVVYNRADCCQDRIPPLQILLSDDGSQYKKVAENREIFDVWHAKDLRAKARYVKIQIGATNFLHLSEIEVY